MTVVLEPIGMVRTDAHQIPRHWTMSDVEGTLVIDKKYQKGLKDVKGGEPIVVIFHFHKSSEFTLNLLVQQPPHRNEKQGVFSICSPRRPNPVGMSVLDVLRVENNIIYVRGIDMLDGTPILDLKPFVKDKYSCPSYNEDQKS